MQEVLMRKIGIFAGAFDPPTLAHLNLIEKSKKICDHLIVVLAHNPMKKALFSKEEKLEMLQKIAKGCEVIGWQGLILDLAKEKKANFLIQGIKEDPMGVQRARGISSRLSIISPKRSHSSCSKKVLDLREGTRLGFK